MSDAPPGCTKCGGVLNPPEPEAGIRYCFTCGTAHWPPEPEARPLPPELMPHASTCRCGATINWRNHGMCAECRRARAAEAPEPIAPRACEVCGEEYRPRVRHSRVCSPECRKERAKRAREAARLERQANFTPSVSVCPQCQGEFMPKGGRKFCSPECFKAYRKAYMAQAYREYQETKGI